MDLSILKELGELPFETLEVAALYQLLGPTVKYLGLQGRDYTKKSIENVERILLRAVTRDHNKHPGAVPSRVLRATINEGAFIEDEIAACYLGGVLASSKAEVMRDDRGVYFNSMISQMSVFQIRLHYVCYTAFHELFQGIHSNAYAWDDFETEFGQAALMIGMGFLADIEHDPKFNVLGAEHHAMRGLQQNGLLDQGDRKNGDEVYRFQPTPLGIELFLWANGHGKEDLWFFYSPDFTPTLPESSDVVLFYGREFRVRILGDNQEEQMSEPYRGIDYAAGRFPCCLLQPPAAAGNP